MLRLGMRQEAATLRDRSLQASFQVSIQVSRVDPAFRCVQSLEVRMLYFRQDRLWGCQALRPAGFRVTLASTSCWEKLSGVHPGPLRGIAIIIRPLRQPH